MLLKLSSMLFLTILFFVNQTSYSQDIDFVDYARYENPPVTSTLTVTNATGETSTQKIIYNPNFSFNGQTLLELTTLSVNGAEERLLGKAFIMPDIQSILIAGSTIFEPSIGEVTLPFDPVMQFQRVVTEGLMVEESRNVSVMLGPIPAQLTISVTFEFIGLEDISLDIGRFEKALHLRTVRTVLLSGVVELLKQDQDEWYHPSASLIQFKNNGNGNVGVLTAIDPPLDVPSYVEHWSLY